MCEVNASTAEIRHRTDKPSRSRLTITCANSSPTYSRPTYCLHVAELFPEIIDPKRERQRMRESSRSDRTGVRSPPEKARRSATNSQGAQILPNKLEPIVQRGNRRLLKELTPLRGLAPRSGFVPPPTKLARLTFCTRSEPLNNAASEAKLKLRCRSLPS